MPDPIADPLAETVAPGALWEPVSLDASPSGVAVVTINRPHGHDAFDGETVTALREAFETLHGADHVRVVFLRGEGGNFCSGLDLDWMQVAQDWTEADNRQDALDTAAMLKALADIPALTVALVEGEAFGGAAGLVAACDVAVATADARFAFPEVRLGLIPAMISPYVVAAIGPRHARALFATGRSFDAVHAQTIGLVHEVAADAEALHALMDRYAEDMTAAAPGAVREAKALVWEVWGRPIERDLMEDAARRLAHRRVGEEGQEGARAHLAGRPPSWTLG